MKRLAILALVWCIGVEPAVGRDSSRQSDPAGVGGLKPALQADPTPPRAALKYRSDLTRSAREAWGLDAPVAALAAQVQQESGWNPGAVSRVGARGMAQFMPDTALWWCQRIGLSRLECQPENPAWSLRALAGYDKWLYERVHGPSEYDRYWAVLRGYNGGLGHWQKEAALVRPEEDRVSIDAACGKARRNISFCPENLGYPRRILIQLQPAYAGWGREVLP